MGVNRRDFLKITGLGTLFGLGGKVTTDLVFKGRIEAQETRPDAGALVGKRWAMVVDTKKCIEKISKDGCRDCSIACHAVHNVPDFGNPKDEIKWIWQDSFEHVFPNQHHPFTSESLEGAPFLAFCNHCDNPPLCAGVPHQGHVQAGRWYRLDGFPSLHRLPLLYGGMPLRFEKLQLARPPALYPECSGGFPDPYARRGGEVQLLCGEIGGGQASGLCRGVQGKGPDIRRPGKSGFGGKRGPTRKLSHPAETRAGNHATDLLSRVRKS